MSILQAIKSAIAGEKQIEGSSESAKQRLHILLIQDRDSFNSPEFLPQLREEIIEVIKKYIPIIANEDVEIKYENSEDAHIIEMSVSLGDETINPLATNRSNLANRSS